ncbi:MAG: acyl carrier protein [Oscillospiraceae bacterium]
MMFEKVCEVIAKTLSCDVATLTPETSLTDDLGADSLDAVELNMALEEEFDIKISDEEIASLSTVGDIVTFVSKGK